MRHSRVEELMEHLGLEPHPEGGYFCEVFCSSSQVNPGDDRDKRTALTAIYFLLVSGEPSCWHRVRSDETWHYYEGGPLELYWIDEERGLQQRLLGQLSEGQSPCEVVPAGMWQAARTRGEYTLVGCTVAPGFDFQDFEMLSERPGEETEVRDRFPELAGLVLKEVEWKAIEVDRGPTRAGSPKGVGHRCGLAGEVGWASSPVRLMRNRHRKLSSPPSTG